MYLPSWLLNASRQRLLPEVCGHCLAGVSILLLEQKPELSLLDFVRTFSTSTPTSVLPFLPVCFSPRRQRSLKWSQRASKKKLMARNCFFTHLKYTQTANSPSNTPARETAEEKNYQLCSKPSFSQCWIKGEFQCTFISCSKKHQWAQRWGCSSSSTFGSQWFDLLLLLWASVNI